jgi:hypothetical protein
MRNASTDPQLPNQGASLDNTASLERILVSHHASPFTPSARTSKARPSVPNCSRDKRVAMLTVTRPSRYEGPVSKTSPHPSRI